MALKTVEIDNPKRTPALEESPGVDRADMQDPLPSRSGPREWLGKLRQRPRQVVGAVVALAILIFGGHWLVIGRFEVKTDNAFIRADIARIATKVQGYVRTVHVEDNQPVKAGEILVTLYGDDFEARLAEAHAALAQAEADAIQAEARVASREAAVQTSRGDSEVSRDLLAEARAAATSAGADADLSSADADRYAELAEKGWYPRAKVEAATAAETSSHAALAQAQASITARRSQLNSSQAHIIEAEQDLAAANAALTASKAAVQAAHARVTSAQLVVDQTKLPAPFDGIVTNRTIAPGQLVAAGQAVMSVVPEGGAYIVANFKETQVEHMSPGQQVRIKVDAYPSLDVTGRVESLSPATGATFSLMPQDTATGNFTKIVQRIPVRIAIDDEAQATGLMRSGLAVVVTVITKDVSE